MANSIFFLFNRRTQDTLGFLKSLKESGKTLASSINVPVRQINVPARQINQSVSQIETPAPYINKVVVFQNKGGDDCSALTKMDGVEVVDVEERFFTGNIIRKINSYNATYNFLYTKSEPLQVGYGMVERMIAAIGLQSPVMQGCSTLVYADHYEVKGGQMLAHPLTDWQKGSVRNDFDFGGVLLFGGKIKESDYTYAALYHAWLYAKEKIHIPEMLYTEQESDLRLSGQKQFDYVNPAQREVQTEMEQAFTAWLGDKSEHGGGAWKDDGSSPLSENHGTDLRITPDMQRRANVDMEWESGVEASVIIPVRNREKTIGDAIRSALSQEADFAFNVIVIDNHSSDKTPAVIDRLAEQDKRVVHLLPQRDDLGIGGCWDLAIRDARCGKFAVQLDSDDLYSSPHTLRAIVDKFRQTKAAMVIGSYQLVDFKLNPLPPGLIDHKEWTDLNGPNNALRINGLGAPRAFFTPVAREVGFPNVSYGEDYAVGLRISSQYKIGRIYESLYLCRRWEGNSDAALSIEKTNRNNSYKDWIRSQELLYRAKLINEEIDAATLESLYEIQLSVWPQVKTRFEELESKVERKRLVPVKGETPPSSKPIMPTIVAQYNPARVRSTAAKVDKQSISERPCFLCQDLQPKEQLHAAYHNRYQLCINPYPILPKHFTLPLCAHEPQLMAGHYQDLDKLVRKFRGYVVFYNGAQCGASAPDHFHFQIGKNGEIPLAHLQTYERKRIAPEIYIATKYPCPALICESVVAAEKVVSALPMVDGENEPRFNLLGFCDEERDGHPTYIVIPRSKHRPDCYYLQGDEQILISPGAIDMAGLLITVREQDYKRLTLTMAYSILEEVGLGEKELEAVVDKLNKK